MFSVKCCEPDNKEPRIIVVAVFTQMQTSFTNSSCYNLIR